MHTYDTSTSPPSSVQQVGWRDRLDLQHDGVVQRWRVSVAGLRLRAVGREKEGGQQGGARVWVRGRVRPLPTLYRGLAGPLAPPPIPRAVGHKGGVGGKSSPLLED